MAKYAYIHATFEHGRKAITSCRLLMVIQTSYDLMVNMPKASGREWRVKFMQPSSALEITPSRLTARADD